jgi:hypothetical protein
LTTPWFKGLVTKFRKNIIIYMFCDSHGMDHSYTD